MTECVKRACVRPLQMSGLASKGALSDAVRAVINQIVNVNSEVYDLKKMLPLIKGAIADLQNDMKIGFANVKGEIASRVGGVSLKSICALPRAPNPSNPSHQIRLIRATETGF